MRDRSHQPHPEETAGQYSRLEDFGRRHYDDLFAYACVLVRDENDAKDLVQESFVNVFRYRHNFEPGTNFRAWAKRIIQNVFISQYRRKQRRQALLEQNNPYIVSSESQLTENGAEAELACQEIQRHVEALPANYRKAFLLHYRGFRYREISEMLGIPVGTAKSQVFTARMRLKKALTADEDSRTPTH